MDDVTRRNVMKLAAAAGVVAAAGSVTGAASGADEKEPNHVEMPVDKAILQSTWRITVAWNNGVHGTFDTTFRNDGTFIAAGGHHGHWFRLGNQLVWAFQGVTGVPDWSIVYASDIAPTGTTLSGIEGWSNTSGKPKGTHSGVRLFTFIAEAAKLTETSPSAAVGGKK